MIKFLPSVCYFPSTVVLVDDNLPFLEGLQLELNADKASYRFFDNPHEALAFLTLDRQSSSLCDSCISRFDDEVSEYHAVAFNLREIHKKALDPKRFDEISVLIVDYAMPGFTGLEICSKLKDTSYKKILLTCEADEFIAVRAFNEGIIHKFIRKDEPNFRIVVNDAIQELQKKYFQDSSSALVNTLITNKRTSSGFLTDPVFIDFFESLIEKLKIIEFYLMDAEGSFMFLDINGRPKWLVVKNEHEMYDLAELAKFGRASEDIVKALMECRQIPYFHTDEELQTPPEKWHNFLHPTQKLVGKEIYYYAIIADPKAHNVGNILSFKKHCEQ